MDALVTFTAGAVVAKVGSTMSGRVDATMTLST
jgi:hypothetical protein